MSKHGPVNCNAARYQNNEPLYTKCERCDTYTPSKGCLFYDWHGPGDWRTKPQFAQYGRHDGATGVIGPTPDAPNYTADPPRNKVEKVPDVLTKLSPAEFAARVEASGGSVGTKLTRVQRAKIADIIEAAANGGLTDEVSITYWVDQIARILSDED